MTYGEDKKKQCPTRQTYRTLHNDEAVMSILQFNMSQGHISGEINSY